MHWGLEQMSCGPGEETAVCLLFYPRASRRLGRGISLLGTLVYVRHAPEMLETHAREDAVLSGEILDAWTDFRRYGEPGKSWKPYDHVQVFDLPGEKNTASRGG